jgi:antitoxin StbD
MKAILADYTISISELKKNPSSVISEAGDEPVAILNHNKPTAYLISAHAYEKILEQLDDIAIRRIVEDRKNEATVTVNLDEL